MRGFQAVCRVIGLLVSCREQHLAEVRVRLNPLPMEQRLLRGSIFGG